MDYKKAGDISAIAVDVITKETLNWIDIEELSFVRIDKNKKVGKHMMLSQTIRMNDLMQFLSKKLYVLAFPPAFDTLDDEEKYQVIHRELLHIPRDKKGVTPFDFEDFEETMTKYPKNILQIMKKADEREEIRAEKEKLKKAKDKLQKPKDEVEI